MAQGFGGIGGLASGLGRTLSAIGTLGMSEVGIRRREQAEEAMRQAQAAQQSQEMQNMARRFKVSRAAGEQFGGVQSPLGRLAMSAGMGDEIAMDLFEKANKTSKPEKRDFEYMAQTALQKKALGMQPTPEEMAAIRTIAQTKSDQVYMDEMGNRVVRPNPYKAVLGSLGMSGAAMQQTAGQPSAGAAMPSAMPLSSLPALESQALEQSNMSLPQGLRAGALQSPVAQRIMLENILEDNSPQAIREREEKAEKKRLTQESSKQSAGTTTQEIDRALGLIKEDESTVFDIPATGFIGDISKRFGGTQARKLDELLKPVRASIAFEAIRKGREASPTGGFLGTVSDKEIDLLNSTRGSLDIAQGRDNLSYNLKRLHNQEMNALHGTPEQIQGLIDEGRISPTEAAPLMQRYDLTGANLPNPIQSVNVINFEDLPE